MTKPYICEDCGHISSHHAYKINNAWCFKECKIGDCNCKLFKWNKRDYEIYLNKGSLTKEMKIKKIVKILTKTIKLAEGIQ